MKLGMLLSNVRMEEKAILAAAKARGIEVERIFDDEIFFDLERRNFPQVDLVLDRSLAHSRAEYTLRLLQSWGIPTVNSFETTVTCDNKFHTNMAFIEAGVPTLEPKLLLLRSRPPSSRLRMSEPLENAT